jgi:hypothetical protein
MRRAESHARRAPPPRFRAAVVGAEYLPGRRWNLHRRTRARDVACRQPPARAFACPCCAATPDCASARGWWRDRRPDSAPFRDACVGFDPRCVCRCDSGAGRARSAPDLGTCRALRGVRGCRCAVLSGVDCGDPGDSACRTARAGQRPQSHEPDGGAEPHRACARRISGRCARLPMGLCHRRCKLCGERRLRHRDGLTAAPRAIGSLSARRRP